MNKVKYGIIGIGGWATEVHIPVINQMDEAEIVALSSRSSENLEKGYENSYGQPKTFSNYLDLLDLEEVDAVVVTTPNHTHAEIAKAALERGKHVFCEKPLAIKVSDCDMLLETAEKAGKILQVGLELRYAPMFVKMKEMIEDGEIGKPCLSSCNLSRGWLHSMWREDTQLTGGIFLELGCHYLDLFGYLLSSQASCIAGFGGKMDKHSDIDHAFVIIDYENGTKASMRLNMLSPYDVTTTVDVVGTTGKIEVDLQNKELTLWKDNSPEYKLSFRFGCDEKEYGFSGTYRQHIDFIDCVRNGKTPKASAEVGRDAVALAKACQKAISLGAVISLED